MPDQGDETPSRELIERLMTKGQGEDADSATQEIDTEVDPNSLVLGPTLRAFQAEGNALPETVCTYCPEAMWRKEGLGVANYCRVMFRDTVGLNASKRSLVTQCDGPFLRS